MLTSRLRLPVRALVNSMLQPLATHSRTTIMQDLGTHLGAANAETLSLPRFIVRGYHKNQYG